MDPSLDAEGTMKEDTKTLEVQASTSTMIQNSVDIPEPCANASEDNHSPFSNFSTSHENPATATVDVDVNVVDGPSTAIEAITEDACTDASDTVSSFGDTRSDHDVSCGDGEVDSRAVRDVYLEPVPNEPGRKRKFTEHWKKFIRPIMWRAKWLELHLKRLRDISSWYDREIAKIEHKKEFRVESSRAEDFIAKTRAIPEGYPRQKVLRRKNRQRCEETSDLGSYMANHTVFSYTGDDSNAFEVCNKINGRRPSKEDELEEDFWDLVDFKDDTNLEGEIFVKIDAIQRLVRSYITRIEKVVGELSEHSSINTMNSPDQSDAFSSPETSHLPISNDASSLGEATPLSHIFESMAMQHARDSLEDEEEVLIHNEAAEEEMRDLRNFGAQCSTEYVASRVLEVPRDTLVETAESDAKSFSQSKPGRRKPRRRKRSAAKSSKKS